MNGVKFLFWIFVCGVVVLGFYTLFNATYLFWHSTGPLIQADLRLDYILEASLWFLGFLVCGGGVAWLLIQRRGYTDQFLVDEE